MSDARKVIPITGKHTTLHSMLAEAMANPDAIRGFVVWFSPEGIMNFGDVNTTRSDVCMAAAYINMLATDMMRFEG